MQNEREYQDIGTNHLIPFANHPFALYTGLRLADMVESIKCNGVLVPIIVRPTENDKYEILSGHNRVAAHHSATKHQGKRIDLLKEIDELLVILVA